MRKTKIISLLLVIIGLSCLGYFILNHSFKRKIKVLDCEASYFGKLFNSVKTVEYRQEEAKVGICLCEKYMKNKEKIYKDEILTLFEENGGIGIIPDAIYKNPKNKVDSICAYRDMIFSPISL